METQLESKKFAVVENILSTEILAMLEPYLHLLPTDKSSYNVWPPKSTLNNTAPECFTCDILGRDRLKIINELYTNRRLPCYKQKWLKTSDIAIQKIPESGFIPKHNDFCIFSLTVFLSNTTGGMFYWWDEKNNRHVVQPVYNTGVIASYDTFMRGAWHEVAPVEEGVRYTLQLFVFDKTGNSEKAIIEELK